jgi:hypothetical protein
VSSVVPLSSVTPKAWGPSFELCKLLFLVLSYKYFRFSGRVLTGAGLHLFVSIVVAVQDHLDSETKRDL